MANSALQSLASTGQIIDLTKIKVEIDFSVDTLDVILIVTTGGLGYLAKKAYQHISTRDDRRRDIEQKNYTNVMDAAVKRNASKVIIKVHKDLPLIVPQNAREKTLAEDAESRTYEITFSKRAHKSTSDRERQ